MNKLLIVGALSVACSGVDTVTLEERGATANTQDATGASIAADEVIHTVDAGPERIEFVRVGAEDGPASILIRASRPNYLAEFAIDVLAESAGTELTPLEIFYSLAPPGSVPHPSLVDYHTQQTVHLGREDDSILSVAFNPERRQEKAWTPAQCRNAILGSEPWVFRVIEIDSTTSVDVCTDITAACEVWVQTGKHRAGVCNNGPGSVETHAFTRHIDTSWATSNPPVFFVAPNQSYMWTFFPRLNGSLTAYVKSAMWMRATTSNGNFHARAAHL